MSERVQYWSRDFMEALVRELRKDATFKKASRKFADRIELRCLDTPAGKDVSTVYRIERGEVVGEYREEPAPSRALREEPFEPGQRFARTTASYELWRRVDQGEVGVLKAIRSPEYRVEGNPLKVAANVGIFRAMNAASGRLDKDY